MAPQPLPSLSLGATEPHTQSAASLGPLMLRQKELSLEVLTLYSKHGRPGAFGTEESEPEKRGGPMREE